MAPTLADRIDALLPQTQCTRCGYPACRPYAEALARGEAEPDQCPPGGTATAASLAALLGRAPRPVNPKHGQEGPPRVAVVDESACIGCAKCLPACPVDAIVGARRYLHTVIAADCTGCDLCLPPCPVDCIEMVEIASEPLPLEAIRERAGRYRRLYAAHGARTAAREARRLARLATRQAPGGPR